MKKSGLLVLMLAFSSISCLVSCGEDSSSSVEQQEVVFVDKVVTYDGQAHSVYVENLPEGAQVSYSGNDQVEPGEYTVTARVKVSGQSAQYLEAKLIIEKKESVLTAEEVQQAYSYQGCSPVYSLNNSEQEVVVSIAPSYRVVWKSYTQLKQSLLKLKLVILKTSHLMIVMFTIMTMLVVKVTSQLLLLVYTKKQQI